MTQLHVLNSWHISRFPGHMSIVDHVLTKETSGNRFAGVIWPISTSCMLISQRITFTPQCQINGVERKRLVCRYAQTARRCHTRRIHSSIHTAAPTRRVSFASTANTSRCGLGVPDEPSGRRVYTGKPTCTVRERYASGKITSVNRA